MTIKNERTVLIFAGLFIILLTAVFVLKKLVLGPEKKYQAKVAIVIDDWGYNLRYIDILREIDIPLTISILPNLRYSSKIARIAEDLGQEVIIHLPLEPELAGREIRLEKHTITAKMSKPEIVAALNLALSSVPDAAGISNHMGSLATKDRRIMSTIFTELKRKGLFFLDNLVTEESIGRELAGELGLEFASRDFFLDNEDDYEYIKDRFEQLTGFALEKGEALGLGHARLKTLQVLGDEIPAMRAKGIKFVFVSDLVK